MCWILSPSGLSNLPREPHVARRLADDQVMRVAENLFRFEPTRGVALGPTLVHRTMDSECD